MASPTSENESPGNRNLLSLYSNYVWNRLHGLYAFSRSNIIGTLSDLRNFAALFRSRKRWECLPLPLSSNLLDSSLVMSKPSKVHGVLEDIFEHILNNLHSIQKNLQFWQSKAQRSDNSKAYFMILERGPWAFIDETVHLLRGRGAHAATESICICLHRGEGKSLKFP